MIDSEKSGPWNVLSYGEVEINDETMASLNKNVFLS